MAHWVLKNKKTSLYFKKRWPRYDKLENAHVFNTKQSISQTRAWLHDKDDLEIIPVGIGIKKEKK